MVHLQNQAHILNRTIKCISTHSLVRSSKNCSMFKYQKFFQDKIYLNKTTVCRSTKLMYCTFVISQIKFTECHFNNDFILWHEISFKQFLRFASSPQQKLLEENPLKSSPEVFVENRINHRIQCRITVAKPKCQT